MNKNTLYVVLAVAVIVIVVLVWRYEAKNSAPKPESQNNDATAQVQKSDIKTQDSQGTFWEGTLKASNNAKKGNLMLVTDKTTIYINTSRDYSDLIGKQVKASYQGTLDNFVLGDITAK